MAPRVKTKGSDLSAEELRASLLRIARKHFALHGFQGASLKNIAQEAQAAGSLINYHFHDKAGLFRACIETFARDRMASIQRILGQVSTREELRVRLQLFVEEMIASIAADPYGFEIIERELRGGNPAIVKLFQETMLMAFRSVEEFFRDAKKNGLLREDIDPMIAAALLFNSTCDSARKDFLAKKFFNVSFQQPEWRSKFVQHVVGMIMGGVVK